jgi:hypothetical protein
VLLESDRYTLLQLFSKHGKVSKLDFLFHKTGPAKGKPRGYAFVEYSAKEVRDFRVILLRFSNERTSIFQDALRALVGLHDRLVRGRKLVVTFAHQARITYLYMLLSLTSQISPLGTAI